MHILYDIYFMLDSTQTVFTQLNIGLKRQQFTSIHSVYLFMKKNEKYFILSFNVQL